MAYPYNLSSETVYRKAHVQANFDSIGDGTNTLATLNVNNLTVNSSTTINSRVDIGGTGAGGNLLYVEAADGEADNDWVAELNNLESTAGRSFGVLIKAGTNGSDDSLRCTDVLGTALFRVLGSGDVSIPNGNLGVGGSPSDKLDVITDTSGGGLVVGDEASADRIDIRAYSPEALNELYRWLSVTNKTTIGATTIVGEIRSKITQATPSALKGETRFYVNTGDTLTEALALSDSADVSISNGNLLLLSIPNSSTGLATGTVWNDSGTLKIVT